MSYGIIKVSDRRFQVAKIQEDGRTNLGLLMNDRRDMYVVVPKIVPITSKTDWTTAQIICGCLNLNEEVPNRYHDLFLNQE